MTLFGACESPNSIKLDRQHRCLKRKLQPDILTQHYNTGETVTGYQSPLSNNTKFVIYVTMSHTTLFFNTIKLSRYT